jgi:hypothetical protein
VELAAWQNWNPDTVRTLDSDCFQFGTLVGEGFFYCPQIAVNATNPPANSPISGILGLQSPSALASLASLAFAPNRAATPPLTVTQNSDPAATSYVYAVVETANTLDLFLENLGSKGPGAVSVALPLAVLAKGAATENSVVATLNIPPSCILSVLCPATVTANFGSGKNTYQASSLGIHVIPFFGPSAHSATPHWIHEVRIPLLVNPQTDPFYFLTSASLPECPNGINQISGICNAFSQTNPPNGSQLSKNTVVGMAPSAAPQCPGPQPAQSGTTPCPTPYPAKATQPVSPTFGFCASFSNTPAAAFFLAIGPDATTYISSPVNLSSAPAGSFPPPGLYPACPSP